jgi:hypothetical protein
MIEQAKEIKFRFLPPTTLPTVIGMKLAIFEIFTNDKEPILEYGFTEWDGTEFGIADPPMEGYTISLYAWAETVDPNYTAPKIITMN